MHDICTFTETKIDDLVSTGALEVEGYIINRQDRTSCGGGVATYIRSTLRPMPLADLQIVAARSGLEVTLTTIQATNNQKVVIVGVYRPPNAKAAWFTEFNEMILQLLNLGLIIIMGDIKADLLKPQAQPGKTLRSSLKLANTRVASIAPTRIQGNSSSCLDIIAVDIWHSNVQTTKSAI